MAPISLIPTACHTCSRTWLALPRFELPVVCPSCHGQAEVVPGESYRAEDIPLFEKIERALFDAQLPEPYTYRLWATLSDVSERWRRPDRVLLPLIDAVPALKFLIDDFAADRAQLARAVGMSLAAITTQLRSFEADRHATGAAAWH